MLELVTDQRESPAAFHVHHRARRTAAAASDPPLARVYAWRPDRAQRPGGRASAARARTATLDGVYVGRRPPAGRQPHLDRPRDCRTAPATSSTRASSAGTARAVFNGRILVRPDAQKTDAKQTNRALLLSDDGAGQLQPAARDLRRRRQVHPRRRGRPARRGGAVLPAGPRAARPTRPATCCCTPSPARCSARSSSDRSCAARIEAALFARLERDLAGTTSDEGPAMTPGAAAAPRPRRRRTTRLRAAVPDPVGAGARAAARLSRQRRHDAEAAGGARRASRTTTRRRTPTSTAACTCCRERATAGVRGGARRRSRASSNAAASAARSSSPATPPRASTWWRRAAGRPTSSAGDEVLISAMEHHSNIVPWQMVCERTGARLRVIPIDDRGVLDLDAFREPARAAHAAGGRVATCRTRSAP